MSIFLLPTLHCIGVPTDPQKFGTLVVQTADLSVRLRFALVELEPGEKFGIFPCDNLRSNSLTIDEALRLLATYGLIQRQSPIPPLSRKIRLEKDHLVAGATYRLVYDARTMCVHLKRVDVSHQM